MNFIITIFRNLTWIQKASFGTGGIIFSFAKITDVTLPNQQQHANKLVDCIDGLHTVCSIHKIISRSNRVYNRYLEILLFDFINKDLGSSDLCIRKIQPISPTHTTRLRLSNP